MNIAKTKCSRSRFPSTYVTIFSIEIINVLPDIDQSLLLIRTHSIPIFHIHLSYT